MKIKPYLHKWNSSYDFIPSPFIRYDSNNHVTDIGIYILLYSVGINFKFK